MTQLLAFVLLGLGPGALYAGLSLGVVLNYRGCGVVNLATGAIAALGAFAFYGLRTGGYLFLPPLPFVADRIDLGAPLGTFPSFLIALAVCAFTGALLDLAVLRPLRAASPLAKLMATLGVFLAIQAVIVLEFGPVGVSAPAVLPNGIGDVVHTLGTVIPTDRFFLAGIVVASALVLAAAYRWSRFGLGTRAAAENETAAVLSGLSPSRLSLANTVLAATVAGGLGILVAPLTQLDSTTIPLAIVPALGAALLAGFTSFGVAAGAGLGMGVIQSVVTYLQTKPWFPTSGGNPLPGVTELIYFVIIAAAMYWRSSALPQRGQLREQALPSAPRPVRIVRPAIVLAAVCVACFLVFPYDFRQALINSLIGLIVCLSLVIITGYVGQASLVQVALGGVAGFVVSKLSVHAGLGFPLGALIGVIASVVFGLVAALSAIRVRGVNLAIVTLAAAVAIEQFGFDNTTWGGGLQGSPVAQPKLFGIPLGTTAHFPVGGGQLPSPVFGLLCTVAVVLAGLFVAVLRRSALGQRMLAVRSNERAAAASGISVRNVKLAAFALSSMLAGVAGVLYAYDFGSVSSARFGAVEGLAFLSFAYIGGITTVTGAILGGLGVTGGMIGHLLIDKAGIPDEYQILFAGLVLILTVISLPEGIAGGARPPLPVRFLSRLVTGPASSPQSPRRDAAGAPAAAAGESISRTHAVGSRARSPALKAVGVSVRYGGVRALDSVDLEVEPGRLVGLIGPNGAGKTTFIDAVTGFAAMSGQVMVDGTDITGLPPESRSRHGLARTWQSADLFDDLSVRENLIVASRRPSFRQMSRELVGRSVESVSVSRALELAGIESLADAAPMELTEGQRKLVGVARALASEPHVVCLDEPAAGLDTTESEALGSHLRQVAASGVAMLLVDHDMGLVLAVCDEVIVLEFGHVIARGTPETVRNDPRVIETYLGRAAASELALAKPQSSVQEFGQPERGSDEHA